MFWIILISGLALATVFAWKNTKSAPVSGLKLKIKDGADKAISTAKDIADVNNDGKVDFADAVAAVKNVEAETKRVVKSAKAQAGKAKKKYGGKVKKQKPEA